MPALKQEVLQRLSGEIHSLRRENQELLRELENAYAQLTAVMQVSQDETRIAYSELQEKVVVLEKKLVELSFLSNVGESLAAEVDLGRLRRLLVEKIGLLVPVDLVALHLVDDLASGTHRERDVVLDVRLDGERLDGVRWAVHRLERDGAGPFLVADLEAGPEVSVLRLRPDACSAACVPLRAGRLLGVLLLNSRLRANFREDQEPLLSAFGSLAAAALQNALRVQGLVDRLAECMAAAGLSAGALRAGGERGGIQVESLRRALHELLLSRSVGGEGGPGRPSRNEEDR